MAVTLCPYRDEDVFPLSLDEPVAEALQAHLGDCPVCRERLARFRSEATTLRLAAQRQAAPVGRKPVSAAPATLGKYYVVGTLAATPRADFYRALHPELSKEVVIRLDREAPADGDKGRERCLREARLLANLGQPGVAQVRDANFAGGLPFLVMDVQGVPLAKTVGEAPLPPERAAGLVAHLARAVEAAHKEGLAARSLTSTTVLLDASGDPWLIDLGLSDETDCGTAATGSAGPAAEWIHVEAESCGLGSLLYYLLVGREPSRAADTAQTELRAAGVPAALEAIWVRAIAGVSAGGYAGTADLAADLERYLRRPRAWLWWGVGAAVALLLANGWWLLRG